MVGARLGYDPFVSDAQPDRIVDLRIVRHGKTLSGKVDIKSHGPQGAVSLGTRELTSDDCEELVSSLAVTIAVGIDPLSLAAPAPSPAAASTYPAPRAEPSKSEDPFADAPPPPRAPAPPAVRLHVSAGPLVSVGASPVVNLGLAVGAAARWKTFSLGGEGRIDLPVTTRTVPGGEISASVLLGSAVPCFHFGVARACALVAAGVLRGSGESVTTPKQSTNFYSALGARAGIELPLGAHLAIGAHADLLATLTRITLRLDDRDAWKTPPASGAGGIDLAGTF
jgi:hypothetical protein